MKRVVFFIISALWCHLLMAQCDSIGQVDFAATAGIGFSNVRAKSNSEISSNFLIGQKTTIHYRLGAIVDVTCMRNLFLESGLHFLHKGYRIVNELGGENEEDYTIHLYYLHIPATANYRFAIEKIWIAPQLGPYFDIALFGKQKGFERVDGEKKIYNEDIFESHKNTYRRLDIGLQVGLNVFFNHYRAGMELDLGILNMYKKVSGNLNPEIRHHNFSFNFAYYFPHKEKQSENTEEESF